MIGQLVALGVFMAVVLTFTHSILTQHAPDQDQETDR